MKAAAAPNSPAASQRSRANGVERAHLQEQQQRDRERRVLVDRAGREPRASASAASAGRRRPRSPGTSSTARGARGSANTPGDASPPRSPRARRQQQRLEQHGVARGTTPRCRTSRAARSPPPPRTRSAGSRRPRCRCSAARPSAPSSRATSLLARSSPERRAAPPRTAARARSRNASAGGQPASSSQARRPRASRSAGSGLSNASRSPVAGCGSRAAPRAAPAASRRRASAAVAACAGRRRAASPAIGWPIEARCTRIWCVRPVWMRTRSSAAPSKRRSTTRSAERAARPARRAHRHALAVHADRGRSAASIVAGWRARARRARSPGTPSRRCARANCAGERAVRRVVLRHHHQRPTCRGRAGARCPGRSTPPTPDEVAARGAAARSRACRRGAPGAGMHDEPGRLVDHEQPRRPRRRCAAGCPRAAARAGVGLGLVDLDALRRRAAGARRLRRRRRRAGRCLVDQRLEARAGELGKAPDQEAVETDAGVVRPDGQLVTQAVRRRAASGRRRRRRCAPSAQHASADQQEDRE